MFVVRMIDGNEETRRGFSQKEMAEMEVERLFNLTVRLRNDYLLKNRVTIQIYKGIDLEEQIYSVTLVPKDKELTSEDLAFMRDQLAMCQVGMYMSHITKARFKVVDSKLKALINSMKEKQDEK